MKLKANGMQDRAPFLRENHINEGTYKQTKRKTVFQKIWIRFICACFRLHSEQNPQDLFSFHKNK